jgi:hypothetical protein
MLTGICSMKLQRSSDSSCHASLHELHMWTYNPTKLIDSISTDCRLSTVQYSYHQEWNARPSVWSTVMFSIFLVGISSFIHFIHNDETRWGEEVFGFTRLRMQCGLMFKYWTVYHFIKFTIKRKWKRMWSGFFWLWMGTSGGLMWMQH